MYKGQTLDWLKLDNAGKIFAATSGKRNTSVFRFSCELFEPVEADTLQKALNLTIEEFPHFLSVLRSGLFWYYLESSPLRPTVHKENRGICSPIYNRNMHGLLFDVSFYENRMNLEVYHALSDGTGVLHFLKTLICYYFSLLHPELDNEIFYVKPYNASFSGRTEDSFRKYYGVEKRTRSLKHLKAYRIKGEKTYSGNYQMIEGIMSCQAVLTLAKKYDATLTVFLAALLIKAIHKERHRSKEDKPIVLTVPVDLRKYFPSDTARNFFGNIRVTYNVSKDGDQIEDLIRMTKMGFAEELTEKKLNQRLSRLMAYENHKALRLIPLFMKGWILRIARKLSDLEETTVYSNVGNVRLPEPLKPYVRRINVFVSTGGLQLCTCSYRDSLSTTFSSVFLDTNIQKNFYRSLTEMGVEVEIRSNVEY
ncbi:hypothetical protein [Clostridium aminobutyricum]|uniref:Alcohol acetyltransferase n=1 Tax=Clostridium aminobutyricum TaxID=33953 RepID=A0A939D8M3_CLOAM|nr:hypothetical protein [Clostridium aminobutyricum]MBN7772728.1 hypothetical protein [Clostridium aminobutyricum]